MISGSNCVLPIQTAPVIDLRPSSIQNNPLILGNKFGNYDLFPTSKNSKLVMLFRNYHGSITFHWRKRHILRKTYLLVQLSLPSCQENFASVAQLDCFQGNWRSLHSIIYFYYRKDASNIFYKHCFSRRIYFANVTNIVTININSIRAYNFLSNKRVYFEWKQILFFYNLCFIHIIRFQLK
jgi:hypothetical protein